MLELLVAATARMSFNLELLVAASGALVVLELMRGDNEGRQTLVGGRAHEQSDLQERVGAPLANRRVWSHTAARLLGLVKRGMKGKKSLVCLLLMRVEKSMGYDRTRIFLCRWHLSGYQLAHAASGLHSIDVASYFRVFSEDRQFN